MHTECDRAVEAPERALASRGGSADPVLAEAGSRAVKGPLPPCRDDVLAKPPRKSERVTPSKAVGLCWYTRLPRDMQVSAGSKHVCPALVALYKSIEWLSAYQNCDAVSAPCSAIAELRSRRNGLGWKARPC